MRAIVTVCWILSVALAGCVGTTSEDPFAYTKKPLFTGSWDVTGGVNETASFNVNDGSIVRMKLSVTGDVEGPFQLELTDPSDRRVLTMESTGVEHVQFAPGMWTVHLSASPDASGELALQVDRA